MNSTVSSRRLAVLISGRGSNLQAIIDAIAQRRLDAEIAVVVSNRPDAAGLERAKSAGIETFVLDNRNTGTFPSRAEYDAELVRLLKARQVGLVCLAGFMRLLSPTFVGAFPNAVLNIHPSLLPAFPGTNAQYQAWEHGAKYSGVTVHLVTAELDGGPIVLQAGVPVNDGDSPEMLAARILEREREIYPQAIELVLSGNWHLEGRRFLVGRKRDRESFPKT